MTDGINIRTASKIYFIGIGGIGVSALVRYMIDQGKVVSGSDRSASIVTEKLEEIGVVIYPEHSADNVPLDVDLIIYTIAIPENNPERQRARELGISEMSYPEALGLISKDMFTIAVSGTHGKTTTTAMLAEALVDADVSPTVIVGSLLKESGSNYIHGESKYLVVEACEYRRSFVNLRPNIFIITNVEADHLDYYRDIKDIQNAFKEVIHNMDDEGVVVCNPNDENVAKIIEGVSPVIVDYSPHIKDVQNISVPGEYNKRNAAAAFAASQLVGVLAEKSLQSLSNFHGTWRRFDFKGEAKNGALVYDDYAHHPTEIRAVISGVREKYPKKKLIIIFQPHLYSRTRDFFDGFIKELSKADMVVLLPVYAAREEFDVEVSSEKMSQLLPNAVFVSDFNEAKNILEEQVDKNTIVMTVGAGGVYKLADLLVKK